MIANSIVRSQVGLILKGLILVDIIHLTKFVIINYPPNVISMYLNRNTVTSIFTLPQIDDTANYDLPMMIRFYNVSPYFINNMGNQVLQLAIFFLLGTIFYSMFQNKITTKKIQKFSKIIDPIYYLFVWDFPKIYFVSNFLKIWVFGIVKLRFSGRYVTISDQIDMLLAITMLFFHFY